MLGKWKVPVDSKEVELQLNALQRRNAAVLDVNMRVRQNFDAAKTVLGQVERMKDMLEDLSVQIADKLSAVSLRDSIVDPESIFPEPMYDM